ncbi:MAG: hypothetical protein IJF80_06985 [Clostridia bacterium]|nr:hypothetical protein [Clostridia bacterium]
MSMIITFLGHNDVPDFEKVSEWLCNVLDQFIYEENVVFYLGGYGGFDRLAASVVRQKQQINASAQAVLVIPYLNRKYDETGYDYTLFPPLESVPPRYAILKRNEWMVTQAEIIIAYVTHSWGGAAKALVYAHRKRKKIVLYPSEDSSAMVYRR